MSIKTSKLKVQPLRGMDTRFNPPPVKARLITDMTWTTEDAWRESGGFDYIAQKIPIDLKPTDTQKEIEYNDPVEQRDIPPTPPCYDRQQDVSRNSKSNNDDNLELNAYETTAVSPVVNNPTVLFKDPFIQGLVNQSNRQSVRQLSIANSDPETEAEATELQSILTSTYESRLHPAPVNMHWFCQFNGAIQWLLYESEDGTLFYFFGSNGKINPWRPVYHIDGHQIVGPTYTNNSGVSTRHKRYVKVNKPWENTHFYTFGTRVYMVNGVNEPLVFDGRKCSRVGYAIGPSILDIGKVYYQAENVNQIYKAYSNRLGVGYNADHQRPDKELQDLGETMESKWRYSYKISYINERGQESFDSKIKTVSGDNYYDTLTSQSMYANITITISTGPIGTVARRIYRTQNLFDAGNQPRTVNFNNEFYFVTEIQDNICQIYNDFKPDSALGALHSTVLRPFPSNVNRVAAFKNTMFYASNEANTVYYSEPRQPEELPIENLFEIGDSVSGPIVAMYPTKNALVIFKRFGIYLIKGDPLNGFFAFTLTKDIGCIASKSVAEIPGKGMVFLGDNGVFLLEGALEDTGTITGITRISDPINKTIIRINKSGSEAVRSCINRKEKEYWLHIPVDSDVRPSMLLKFHYEVGEWSISENFEANDILCTDDHRNYVHLATSDTNHTNKGLMVYSHAFKNKGKTTLDPKYKTIHIPVGSFYSAFDVVRVQVMAVSYGNNSLECNYLVNREVIDSLTTSLSQQQKRVLEDSNAPVYNTATLDGTYKYAEHRPIPIRFDLTTMQKGPVQEISFTFNPTDHKIQILGYMIEVRYGGKKEFVTLTESFGGSLTR
tara:strand:+ start:2703 stop:5210 length:2508 start_codon:yes stop_codon:yes gene_type:complete